MVTLFKHNGAVATYADLSNEVKAAKRNEWEAEETLAFYEALDSGPIVAARGALVRARQRRISAADSLAEYRSALMSSEGANVAAAVVYGPPMA